ncbi:methyl-accepting chemotaxis protein [Pseudoalteromonas sp. HM-SA03]|uniref:methyl-accepting chemotaxis protein n=1 Tax=Pseudoalteromonas sp. HM-SA03 TaxID=2029678 RepID=UPI0020CFF452|nr:methyl-accepting chemotaxis protein [Pseudoalteromonas sp. HM-SA03]
MEGVVDVSRGLSEQTNLLYLNAAIKAVRNGEYVVADDEVRALWQRTQDSIAEINTIIAGLTPRVERELTAIQSGVERSSECVVKAEGTKVNLETINTIINEILGLNYQIATSTEEMSSVSNELKANAVTISGLADESIKSACKTHETMKNTEQALENEEVLVEQFIRKLNRAHR